MKINFILDGIGTSGGIRVVFNLANYLVKQGHDAKAITLSTSGVKKETPGFDMPKTNRSLKNLKHFIFVQKLGLNIIPFPHSFPIKKVPSLKPQHIPDADIVIATACKTAFFVDKYPRSKGVKYYYIQDFEDWSNTPEKALLSWNLPLKTIVTCKHLSKMYWEKTGKKPHAIVYPGLEKKFFSCHPEYSPCHPEQAKRVKGSPQTILMIYNSAERKGGKDGIKVLQIVKKQFPNISIDLFGIDKSIKKYKSWAKVHYFPSQKKLVKLYRQADIFVCPSRKEGFGLPGLEALASQCALASTDVGAVREYSRHGKSSLISPPENQQALAKNIVYLIKNPQKARQMGYNGFMGVKKFTLEKSGEKLEKTFNEQYNA